jgi:hypothetical protein
MFCRLMPRQDLPYTREMPNTKYDTRILALARSSEKRLRKLQALIRREFRAGSDRQLNALSKVEHAIALVARDTERQRELLQASRPAPVADSSIEGR